MIIQTPRRVLLQGLGLALVLHAASVRAQSEAAPTVASMEPPAGATNLDARTATEFFVTFDRPMTSSHSVVGGGPNFPKNLKVGWLDNDTCVIACELEPDRSYRFSLNGGRFQNFKSVDGVPLAPFEVTLATKRSDGEPSAKQRERNQDSLDALRKVLETQYSHFNLRGHVLEGILNAAESELLASNSDWTWARTVATSFSMSGDVHLWVKHGEEVAATRALQPPPDSMIRDQKLPAKLTVVGTGVACATTKGGYGYLRIDTWDKRLDLQSVFKVLAELRETKGLLLDVRTNGGGDENLAKQVAAWFVTGSPVYAKHEIAPEGWLNEHRLISKRSLSGNEDANLRFDKPTVVLMSSGCVSSCEAFLLMMAQAEHVTLVGQISRGASGNPQAHAMPNGVTVWVPSWRSYLPDGTPLECKGVKPDVLVSVQPEDFEVGDPILQAGLRVLHGGS